MYYINYCIYNNICSLDPRLSYLPWNNSMYARKKSGAE